MNVYAACSTESDHPSHQQPFRAGPWVLATDGRQMLAEWRDWRYDDHPAVPIRLRGATDLLEDGLPTEWLEADVASLRQRCGKPLLPERCPECEGDGFIMRDDGWRDEDCWRCDGSGYVIPHFGRSSIDDQAKRAIAFGYHVYDRRLIAGVLVHVDCAVIRIRQRGDGMLQFRWADGLCRAVVAHLSGEPGLHSEWLV